MSVDLPPHESERKLDSPAVPFRGDLADHPFPNLLHSLHGTRATGTLLLTQGKKRKAVQVRDGYPVAVKSNLISECLGNYLVRRGQLARKDFEASLAKVKRGDGRHGEILVVMDLLSEEAVSRALCEQAEEKLFEIFEWLDGSFKFKVDARIRRGNDLALTRSPANLIVEGARRRSPIELVDAFIAQNADGFVVLGCNPIYRFQAIDLDAKEAELLRMVNGRRRLDYFRTADPALRRLLYGLISTQILELRDAASGSDDPLSVSDSILPTSEQDAQPMRAELAAMVERLHGESYFEMFALSSSADASAIDSAYAECARRLHPDGYQNASGAQRQLAREAFEILSKAHETLLDPKRRSEYEMGLRVDARQMAQRAASQRLVTAQIEFQKGEVNLRCRNYEDALAEFGKALELNESEGEYHAHYGWCLFLCHQDNEVMIEEAVEHVRRGAKLARDRDKPYLFLGRLYKVMGRIRAAEKMFARAVQIQPDCVDALRELRLINMRRAKSRSLLSRFFPARGLDD